MRQYAGEGTIVDPGSWWETTHPSVLQDEAVLLAGVLGSAAATFLASGRRRWAISGGLAALTALAIGVPEWLGEGPFFAALEAAVAFSVVLLSPALRALAEASGRAAPSLRPRLARLLFGVAALALAAAVAGAALLWLARRDAATCARLLAQQEMPFQDLERHLSRVSVLPVRCRLADGVARCHFLPRGIAACSSVDREGRAGHPERN